jgi:5,10-methylenetetrahydromethanopterin reductase
VRSERAGASVTRAAGPTTFSLRLNNDLSVREFTELASAADDSGFDQVWVSHDLFWRSAPVLVAAAAAVTSHVRLGIGIMNPFSAHPSELAMHAATLQELSDGRFLLGIGAGAGEFLAWAGLARPRPLSAARQAVTACRALLQRASPASDPAVSPATGAGSRAGAREGWQPEAHLRWDGPPVPIYLGAMGPKMLALGGEVADGVLGLSFPPERAAASAAIVRAAAREAGRDPASVDVPACFWCSIDDDPERAAGPLAEKLAYYGPSISAAQLADSGLTPASFLPAARALQRGDAGRARELITPQMLRLGVFGNAGTIVERCRGLAAAGASHLSFGPPLGPDPVTAVVRLGREVLPALRADRPGP